MIDISYIHLVWVLAALTCCAVGLISIWAALGQPHWFWRIAVVGAMLGLTLPIEAHDLLLIYFTQAIVVSVPLTVVRYFRRRRASGIDEPAGDALIAKSRPRFSLLDLFLGTLVAAVVFAAAVDVPEDIWDVAWNFVARGSYFGLATLAAAWLGLGRRWLWIRILFALVLVPPVSAWFRFDYLFAVDVLFSPVVSGDFWPLHGWIFGLAIAALTATWLLIARRGGFVTIRRDVEHTPSGPVTESVTSRVSLFRGTRIAAVLLSLLILSPLAVIYYFLLTPTPIPKIVLPVPNAYDDLVDLGNRLTNVAIPGDNVVATESTLRPFMSEQGDLLDEARSALQRDCRVPLDFPGEGIGSDQIIVLRNLALAFRAEGNLAALDGRFADALRSYLNAIQLGQAATRGGLVLDDLIGIMVERFGQGGVYNIREEMSPKQRREMIHALLTIDESREPYEDILFRDKVWTEHAYGWTSRLEVVLVDLTGDFTWTYLWTHMGAIATSRLLICELATLNYQTDHQRAPEMLAELVPDYLPAVPLDPFSSKPLVYRRTSDGYVLYSIGPDEQDNGGRGTSDGELYADGRDIVLDAVYVNTDDTSTPDATTE